MDSTHLLTQTPPGLPSTPLLTSQSPLGRLGRGEEEHRAVREELAALKRARLAQQPTFTQATSGHHIELPAADQVDDLTLVRAMSSLSEEAFARVWDNPADAAYDEL